ncbi:MAG: glucosaminidase domain-containing protein [Hyphomicrobium sp.]|nr:glucosaminidase domain-containing protein [Hyphomicrobium sp.]
MNAKVRAKRRAQNAAAAFVCHLLLTTAVHAAPPIRTSENNRVPSCVSPERLMAFLRDRNEGLEPRYGDIARWYKYYGEAWKVRWDYAFYQMVLETNYLKYRRGNGRRGDVHERQNNFAGIGATGGGVPGERFADIKTGVHAQIQHLVAYSGERVRDPVAKRTDENQDDIIAKSQRLGRPVTFGDLARRWAADRAYARSIDVVAKLFNDGYCKGPATADIGAPPSPKPAHRFERPTGLGGPRPPHLSSEEVLPWAGGSIAENQDAPDVSTETGERQTNRPAPKTSSPHTIVNQTPPSPDPSGRSPVRTLWTREDGYMPAGHGDVAPSGPADAPAGTATDGAPLTTRPAGVVPEQARPGGSSIEDEHNPQYASSASSDSVELPHFRVAPADPGPSRLGGPADVPVDENTRGTPLPAITASVSPGIDSSSGMVQEASVPTEEPISRATIAAAQRPAPTRDCRIVSASYGGRKTLLVQADTAGAMQLTALTVLDGFEDSMLANYAKARAPGAKVIGTFKTKDDALSEARNICPSG